MVREVHKSEFHSSKLDVIVMNHDGLDFVVIILIGTMLIVLVTVMVMVMAMAMVIVIIYLSEMLCRE